MNNEKTTKHLIRLIVTRNGKVPNFSILLGAGASETSGVKTARKMITDWRHQLFQDSGVDVEYNEWLNNQCWHYSDDEYSILFEKIFDRPVQRRVYIEECIRGAHPSWGYVYLADLLANRFFNVVLTTNFDDLMNEACHLYSDGLRPIVAAHDSTIQNIRISSERPKIIKLHGDFLYDDIKNTVSETDALADNTSHKLNQFAKEYGLVVLGYSGRDQSVMNTLEKLLQEENNYRQGIYWCIHPEETISNRLCSFLEQDRVYPVTIDRFGFDGFVADLHNDAALKPPRAIVSPYEMVKDRLDFFVGNMDFFKSHAVIGSHIKMLQRGIAPSVDESAARISVSIAPQHLAILFSSQGRFREAIPYWAELYKQDPADLNVAVGYANALDQGGEKAKLLDLVHESNMSILSKTFFLLRADRNSDVIRMSDEFLGQVNFGEAGESSNALLVRINRAIALKRIKCADALDADLKFLEQNVDSEGADRESVRVRIGVAALKDDLDEVCLLLTENPEIFSAEELKLFPVFEGWLNDPAFLSIVGSLK